MPSKLGFHLYGGPDTASALARLRDMQPSVLVVVDDINLMNAAYDTIGPGPIYVFRQRIYDNPEAYIAAHGGVDGAVTRFLQEVEPAANSLQWAYHMTFRATRITDELAQFEALAIQRAREELRIRLCAGNFAAGIPGDPHDWRLYRPALEEAVRYNALIGLREYYPALPYVGYGPNTNIPDVNSASAHRLSNELPYPQGYRDPGQFIGHYRHLRDYCRQQDLPARMVITESGAGRVLDPWLDSFASGLGGWNTLGALWQGWGYSDRAGHYLQDLIWLDQHVYGLDPEIVGVSINGWNADQQFDIGTNARLIDLMQNYLSDAHRDQPLPYALKTLAAPAQFRVIVQHLRSRPLPIYNCKPTSVMDFDHTFTTAEYAFTDGYLWVKHNDGWSAYAPLYDGNPQFDEKFLEGPIITTPRQDRAVNNFVASIDEVRNFLAAHDGNIFYIAINQGLTPDGARRFTITTFPPDQARRVLDALHPEPGDPRMSPAAKNLLRDAGQL